VIDLISNLVARSLVDAEPGAQMRYRLLETIRQYGEERLAELGETDDLRARHCDFYTAFVGDASEHLFGLDQPVWGARLAQERDNLHAAMAFAVAIDDADRALDLLCALPAESAQVNDVVHFDPVPILALTGAGDRAGSSVGFMVAAFDARARGDFSLANELIDEAIVVESRLGPVAGSRELDATFLRGLMAGDLGRIEESVSLFLEAAHLAEELGLAAMAAQWTGAAALTEAPLDSTSALRHANEGLALARETGMPTAISINLVGIAQALAIDEPDRARRALHDALAIGTTLEYENTAELAIGMFAAARLGMWRQVLVSASRLLYHEVRSGPLAATWIAGALNCVARGLAEVRPETAAIIQGAVVPVVRRLTAAAVGTETALPEQLSGLSYVVDFRRDATAMLVEAFGRDRLGELRARGEAMRAEEACAWVRRQIDDLFASGELDVEDG